MTHSHQTTKLLQDAHGQHLGTISAGAVVAQKLTLLYALCTQIVGT